MSAVPLLRVIDGGTAGRAPQMTVSEADRFLVPTVSEGGHLLPLVAGLAVIHAAAIAAVMHLGLFGVEGAGQGDEAVVIEEVEVVLLDLPPAAAVSGEAAPEPAEPAAVAPEDMEPVRESVDGDKTAPAAALDVPEPQIAVTVPDSAIERPAPAETQPDAAGRMEDGPGNAPPGAPVEEPEVSPEAVPMLLPAPTAVERANRTGGPAAVNDEASEDEAPAMPSEIAVMPRPRPEPPAPAAAPSKAPAKAASAPAKPPSSSAGGSKAGGGDKAALASYHARLAAHLRAYSSYPAAAAAGRLSGRAMVNITIDRSGKVVGASIARGTGHAVLDREALAMVRRASPFPPIPAALGTARLSVTSPIRFAPRR